MIRYLKDMDKEIIISNDQTEVTRIAQFIDELGMSLQLSSDTTMTIGLAIEEAVTNIIRHAYPTVRKSEITLRVHISSNVLTFLIIDDGISFDPTIKELSDTASTLDQRLTEGLGLLLIRRTMDEVHYHTTEGKNQLTLMKHVDMNIKPEATLKTNICKIEDVTILTIEGRLDTVNANEFSSIIQPLLTNMPSNIIINCEGMTYISSSGLRHLIVLQKSVLQHHAHLAIEALRPEIQKIFDMTGCSSLFTIR